MTSPSPLGSPVETAQFNMGAQAVRAAETSARRAGVRCDAEVTTPSLLEVSHLLEAVWGRSTEGVPISSEVLRGIVHAGGGVTTARTDDGALAGAAVLIPSAAPSTMYSMIAAVSPGGADRGVGQALKLAQRSWALERGFTVMRWTFDPLVGRNARFNLAKLGAVAVEYETAFYGPMTDQLNGTDDSDRLVATWQLGDRRTVAASEGTAPDPAGPAADARVITVGPDDLPMLVQDAGDTWCRIPHDIVDLRRTDPGEAHQWRLAARAALLDALARGLIAVHVTRNGWYQLSLAEDLS